VKFQRQLPESRETGKIRTTTYVGDFRVNQATAQSIWESAAFLAFLSVETEKARMSGRRDSCRLKDLSAFLTICANVWLAGRLTSASCSCCQW